jgi:hypothetical protein
MGNDLKQKILVQNGIISEQQIERKPSILNCPRCSLINAVENKYCSKCSYSKFSSIYGENPQYYLSITCSLNPLLQNGSI